MSLTLTTALAVLRDGAAATSGGGDGDRRRRAGTRGDGTSWKVTWVLVKLSAGREMLRVPPAPVKVELRVPTLMFE